jgi:putative restriction endonuclease
MEPGATARERSGWLDRKSAKIAGHTSLPAPRDAAFDRGLISFADDGTALVSALLSEGARTALVLSGTPHLVGLRDAHRKNLALHRTCNGFG